MADTAPDFTANRSGPAASAPAVLHFEEIIDCAANNLASGESHALFDIPKGLVHLSTAVEVLTAEGGAATADIGVTGTDVDSLIDGVDLNASAGTLWQSGNAGTAEVNSILGSAAGYITAADVTFSLLANAALDTAVFRVVSKWLDMRGQLPDPT